MRSTISTLLFLLCSFWAFAQNTVVDIIVNSPDHDTLEIAVGAAGLTDALSGDGPFTVFAPTDDAFAALPDGVLDALLADPTGDLAQILQYHVLGANVQSGDLSDNMKAMTLQGRDVLVAINSEDVFINNAKVTMADIPADNGVVHVIDVVLTPPTTVVDIVTNSVNLDTLEAAVTAAGLGVTLSGDGPFTVFAPTDDAFAALPEGTIDALLGDPTGELTQILLHHVIPSTVLASDLADGLDVLTSSGKEITVTLNENGAFIDDAQVIVTDLETDNGVVHVLNAVLTPPSTVMDIIAESPNHTFMETLIGQAGLTDELNSNGDRTVFAPTDAAVQALPPSVLASLASNPQAIADLLNYHIVDGVSAESSSLSNGQTITTKVGDDILVTIRNDSVFINGTSYVEVVDLVADNGVVHVLDAVLFPPNNDVQIQTNETFGNIITDSFGRSLYFFSLDADSASVCTGGCLANWPAFYAENPSIGTGLDAADFGEITREDGSKQTTYKGWPLYYFINDAEPGDLNGDAVNNVWWVAKPDYTIMLVNNQLVGNDNVNYLGDYTPGDEVIQYFTDANGATLYIWSRDNNGINNFTNPDFSNNGIWPIFEDTTMVVPSTLNPDDFAVIDVFGRSQLTYKGWPLYYFSGDGFERGSNKGVSVPQPGIWPVAIPSLDIAPEAPSVVEIIVDSEDHTVLEQAVTTAGLVETLNGDGPFTVFAPTDDAFTALGQETIEAVLADPDGLLTDILLYHVLDSKVLSTDLMNGMRVATLNGDSITVTIDENGVFINDAQVTVANVQARNGVVHVIDAVLMPPTTVWDIIVDSEEHTVLETAVETAGLDATLNGEGSFTVFAPTDDAFTALGQETIDAVLADPQGLLTEILLYHVLDSEVRSTDLMDGTSTMTLNGKNITVTINEDSVFINDALVTMADIETDNGVVHVIDAVLLPPTTVWDIIEDSEDHTTLETAIETAGLDGTLQGDGPFTVFAPTDDAFTALGQETIDAVLADPQGLLTEILLYHVLDSEVRSTDLMDGTSTMTLNGKNITVAINEDSVFINDALVTMADIETDNGVVHVIDAVLLPPTTVWDIIEDSEDHTTLETAIETAGLDGTLQGDGPFTVFAPTDDAFTALGQETIDAVLADPQGLLTEILLYHVLDSEVRSTDLMDGTSTMTLNGKNITVAINEDSVFINDALVTMADIETDNGVVHVIDAVLLPPTTVWDIIVESENHTVLETVVSAAGLDDALNGDGPLTVFAPNDDAFAAIPQETINELLADPTGNLTTILLYHVVADRVLSTDLMDGMAVTTLQGGDIDVAINSEGVFVDNAEVIAADLEADNGVVHVIDSVLLAAVNTRGITYELVGVNVYPNPTAESFTLDWQGNFDAQADIRLINASGQLVKNWVSTFSHQTFDVKELPSGTYFLEVTSENKKAIKMIMIE